MALKEKVLKLCKYSDEQKWLEFKEIKLIKYQAIETPYIKVKLKYYHCNQHYSHLI